jgi:hypothetical protein
MTDEKDQLAGLGLDRAIHLRWVLRDIKGKRTKLSPVSPDDLRTLIQMNLVEMQDEIPVLTHAGDRALNWCPIAKSLIEGKRGMTAPDDKLSNRSIVIIALAMIAATALTIEGTYLVLKTFVFRNQDGPLAKTGGLKPDQDIRAK